MAGKRTQVPRLIAMAALGASCMATPLQPAPGAAPTSCGVETAPYDAAIPFDAYSGAHSCPLAVTGELQPPVADPRSVVAISSDGRCQASYSSCDGVVWVDGLYEPECTVTLHLANGRALTTTVEFRVWPRGPIACTASFTDASAFEPTDAGAVR